MPIERPHLGRFGAPLVVSVHVVTPREGIQQAMASAIGEITAAMKAQGVAPCGAWFAHHHRKPNETFDFEVCFPVETRLAESGQLRHKEIPELGVVRTAYHGPYDGLPGAWSEFAKFVESEGHKTRADLFEVYSLGPRESTDPAAWQTDLIMPLEDGLPEKEGIV